jgi:hypothetical protein
MNNTNSICKECKICCNKYKLYYISEEEYIKLEPFIRNTNIIIEKPKYLKNMKKNKENLYKLAYYDTNCKLLTENGCILPYEVRPNICRVFPYNYEHIPLNIEESHYKPTTDCPHCEKFVLNTSIINEFLKHTIEQVKELGERENCKYCGEYKEKRINCQVNKGVNNLITNYLKLIRQVDNEP